MKDHLSINKRPLFFIKGRLFSNNLGLFFNTPYLFQNTFEVILISPKVNIRTNYELFLHLQLKNLECSTLFPIFAVKSSFKELVSVINLKQ